MHPSPRSSIEDVQAFDGPKQERIMVIQQTAHSELEGPRNEPSNSEPPMRVQSSTPIDPAIRNEESSTVTISRNPGSEEVSTHLDRLVSPSASAFDHSDSNDSDRGQDFESQHESQQGSLHAKFPNEKPHDCRAQERLPLDKQAKAQTANGSFNDSPSGSATEVNPNLELTTIQRGDEDDLLPDTQVNSQSVNGYDNGETRHSIPLKTLITNHFRSSKLFGLDSVLSPQKEASCEPVRGSGHAQPLYFTDANLADTQISHASELFSRSMNGKLAMRDEDLADTQIGTLLGPDSRAPDHTTMMKDKDLVTRQSYTPLSCSQYPARRLSISASTDDDSPDSQAASIAPTSFRREPTAASTASVNSDFLDPSAKVDKGPLNKLSCRERKRIAVSYNRPPCLTKAMTQWVTKTHRLLDPFREDDDCWFHPLPPSARITISGILRPCGKLQKRFTWQDHRGKHSLVLNYGIVSKIINYRMTKQQKDGFINKQWHLSHLCGNWTCLNATHTTVEPGAVNISRNNCFSHRSGCSHDPKCMKDKKVSLAPDGKPIDHNASMRGEATQKAIDHWDDWSMQSFDDGEVSVSIDDQDETEFVLLSEDEDEEDESREVVEGAP
ncbi:hypothetical protein EG329_008580 [Mollisiaceae sp. DMI_Dod_QoI]|nr:hypothetical protein EG329_008580 [Helotiales sp. DMI_Dod_QoI]